MPLDSTSSVNVHVMLVDDDPATREIYTHVLSHKSYQFRAVPCRSEAVAAFEQGLQPHLLLIDLRMDGISLPQFVGRTREILGDKVKIVGLSSFSSQAAAVQKNLSLLDAFEEKPSRIQNLELLVDKYLNQEKAPDSHPNQDQTLH